MPRRRTFLLPGSPLCAHKQHIFSSHPRISCGRRGTAPPVHSGATHPCTNSAARAAGGESPPLRAHLGDPHPAQVPQLERPRGAHTPLSRLHAHCGTRCQHSRLLRDTTAVTEFRPCTHTLCSRMSCPFIFIMRHCAPSDIPEKGSGYESG